MPDAPSKRKSTQERTEALLGVGFVLVCAVAVYDASAAAAVAGAYSLLCAAIGYSGGKYISGETKRPSGTPAAEPR